MMTTGSFRPTVESPPVAADNSAVLIVGSLLLGLVLIGGTVAIWKYRETVLGDLERRPVQVGDEELIALARRHDALNPPSDRRS